MFSAVLVSTSSSIWTSADFARRSPAIKSSSEVLPAPEGPKIAATRLLMITSTSRVNGASGSKIFLSTSFMSVLPPAQQAFTAPDREKRQHHGNAQQAIRLRIIAQLHRLKNRER